MNRLGLAVQGVRFASGEVCASVVLDGSRTIVLSETSVWIINSPIGKRTACVKCKTSRSAVGIHVEPTADVRP
nr:MAG TPA: hypothetical protein [Caudoviricetes sp.]